MCATPHLTPFGLNFSVASCANCSKETSFFFVSCFFSSGFCFFSVFAKVSTYLLTLRLSLGFLLRVVRALHLCGLRRGRLRFRGRGRRGLYWLLQLYGLEIAQRVVLRREHEVPGGGKPLAVDRDEPV